MFKISVTHVHVCVCVYMVEIVRMGEIGWEQPTESTANMDLSKDMFMVYSQRELVQQLHICIFAPHRARP